MPNLHQLLDGLALSAITGMFSLFFRLYRKSMQRMDRDDSLKRDYPPHRHINGSRIMYPKEYQPSRIENLNLGAE